MNATRKITLVTLVGSIFDIALGLAKIVVGIQVGGQSLIVDGFHSLSDFLGDVVVIGLSWMSLKGPDEDHPYGHGKFETLGTVMVGAILVAVAGALGMESIRRWLDGDYINIVTTSSFVVATVSLVVKEILFHMMKNLSKEMNSPLILANAWHSRSDALGSLAVLLGLIGSKAGLPWTELLAALLVSIMIGHIGLKFLWDAVKELTDTSVSPKDLLKIKEAVLKVPGVQGMHAVRSRSSKGEIFLDLNVEVAPFLSVSEGHQVALWAMKAVQDTSDRIKDVVVHIDIGLDLPEYSLREEILLPLRESFTPELYRVIRSYMRLDLLIKLSCHYGEDDLMIELYFQNGTSLPKQLVHHLNHSFTLEGVKRVKFVYWGLLE